MDEILGLSRFCKRGSGAKPDNLVYRECAWPEPTLLPAAME
jgi:hypothetical protein